EGQPAEGQENEQGERRRARDEVNEAARLGRGRSGCAARATLAGPRRGGGGRCGRRSGSGWRLLVAHAISRLLVLLARARPAPAVRGRGAGTISRAGAMAKGRATGGGPAEGSGPGAAARPPDVAT